MYLFGELYAVYSGHFYVHENNIELLLRQQLHDLGGTSNTCTFGIGSQLSQFGYHIINYRLVIVNYKYIHLSHTLSSADLSRQSYRGL